MLNLDLFSLGNQIKKAKENAIISENASELGEGLVIAAEASSILIVEGTGAILNGKSNIISPLNTQLKYHDGEDSD